MPNLHRVPGLFIFACLAGASFAVAAPALPQGKSIQLLMIQEIDPAADRLWGAVGIEENAKGTAQRAPRTPAQWNSLRDEAQRLIAGAQALKASRLPVGGKTHSLLADATTPGIRSAEQIRADIDRNPAKFVAAADRLYRAGNEALSAITVRDAERLTRGGAAIDAACESCHAAYWYPRGHLALPSAEEFGHSASRP